MKQIKFIILLLLTFSKTYGQAYFSFIDTNSVWRDLRVLGCDFGASTSGETDLDGEEFLKGDTIIGKKYNKLFLRGAIHSWYRHWPDPGTDTTIYYCDKYIGGLREDTLKYVYYIDTTGIEKLLYNFNMAVGDSMLTHPSPGGPNWYLHVISIDSVYIFNGYRKRINLDAISNLIEGVGMSLGLLGVSHYGPAWQTCIQDRSKAYFYKNTKAYSFPTNYPQDSTASLLNCNFTGVNDISLNNNIKLYPNPANDIVTIELLNSFGNKNVKISIVDNLGRILLKQTMSSNLENIDLRSLDNGIYFLKFSGIQDNDPVIKIVKIRN